VSSGRSGPSASRSRDPDRDSEARIAELERENEALRAAVKRQRRENERIVDRYERLLDRDCGSSDAERSTDASRADPAPSSGALVRLARFLGL